MFTQCVCEFVALVDRQMFVLHHGAPAIDLFDSQPIYGPRRSRMAFDLAGSNLSRPYRLHYAFAASASKRHFLYCGRFCIVRLVGIDRPSSVTEQSELRSHRMSVAGQSRKNSV